MSLIECYLNDILNHFFKCLKNENFVINFVKKNPIVYSKYTKII